MNVNTTPTRGCHERKPAFPTSRGRFLVVLFNTARPHSWLDYETPAAITGFIGATGVLAIRLGGLSGLTETNRDL
ncbi:hypothetical protein MESS2_980011 [Mesorhizobium metallidurans STM 2683]|uniref:Uncharacterized protein n=1 Tax=Mesorhizobium metallidurans STM 2683 TaxID=1297569 RepID=M5EWA5_9HYPH|nr:hypothetical protein MESS2_980011 [Mesorhizobium metallidurans STM 2683]